MKKVVILLLFCTFFIFPATSVDKLKSKAETIDKTIKQNQENIKIAKKQENEEMKQMAKLDGELNQLKENYYEIEEKLQKITRNLGYTEKNIIFINHEIESSNKYFSDTIYKYNNYLFVSNNEFLLGGYDMNKYFEVEEMKSLFGNVVNTLESINTEKKDVINTRTKISNEKTEVEVLKAELEGKRVEIEDKKLEKDRLVKSLKNSQVTYGKEISVLKKQKSAIEKQIANIIKARIKPVVGKFTNPEVIKQVGYLSMPLDGTVKYNFGQEKSQGIKSSAMEIKGKLGQRVTAANKGEVIFAGPLANLGNVVIISHGYNLISTYGNLISVYVGVGTQVKKGEQIGVLGLSTDREPVLYFETRISSKSVDPRLFLR